MPEVIVRKTVVTIDEIYHEGGTPAATPHKRGAIASVVKNPYAGKYHNEITPFIEDMKPLGLKMAQDLLKAMKVNSDEIEGYGKGAIIGADGELEHGALWHAPGGYSMREVVENSKAIVPSTKKVGAVGARLDVPITHANASYVRSHFDAFEVGINDAPHADEMVVILTMTTGPRIHARSGGLAANQIKGEDGLK